MHNLVPFDKKISRRLMYHHARDDTSCLVVNPPRGSLSAGAHAGVHQAAGPAARHGPHR